MGMLSTVDLRQTKVKLKRVKLEGAYSVSQNGIVLFTQMAGVEVRDGAAKWSRQSFGKF